MAGCSAIALTDHDGLGGVRAAGERARQLGVRLVPGCEVSCAWLGISAHVLCYFIGEGAGPLADELGRLRDDRERRNRQLVGLLSGLGVPVTYEEVLAEAGGRGVGRPHFAAVLVRLGVASSIQDAFDTWLGTGGRAYLSKARVDPLTILGQAAASGGVAVLAHPLSLGLDPSELDTELRALVEAGLGGLECYYGRYDPATRADLAALARRHRLVPTGGSDFHGTYKPDLAMGIGTGDLEVPDEVLDELEALVPTPSG